MVKQRPFTEITDWALEIQAFYAGMYYAEADQEACAIDVFLKKSNTWVASYNFNTGEGWVMVEVS